MKRVLYVLVSALLFLSLFLVGCNSSEEEPKAETPPEELPPVQTETTLAKGLACRMFEDRTEYEIYAADAEQVRSLSGTVILPSYYKGFPVTSIADYTFQGCTQIEEVILPEGLIQVGKFGFSGSGLVRISIPDTCTSLEAAIFSRCSKLESVKLPPTLLEIYGGMFFNCTSLKEIELPESLIKIESEAFQGCSSLESIILPSNLQQIGSYAFLGCTSLGPDLYIPESVQIIGLKAFKSTGVRSVVLFDTFQVIREGAFEFATIYTAAPRGVSGLETVLTRFESCIDSLFFYNTTLRYDGEAPYVYCIDGVDFMNVYLDIGCDYEKLTHAHDDDYYNFPVFSPYRKGYEFKGWSTTEGSNEVDFGLSLYDPKTSPGPYGDKCERYGQGPFLTSLSLMREVRLVKAHQPLYAVWEPIA